MNGKENNINPEVTVEPKDEVQPQEQPKQDEGKEQKTFTREELASAVSAQLNQAKEEFKKTLADEVAKALEEKLAQQRADIEARERKLNTRDALAAAGLHIPSEDVDLFVQKDIDTTHRMIDRFKNLVQIEVQNQIHQRTATKETPRVGANPTKTISPTKSFDQMSYEEKRQLFQEDPAAYQALKDKSVN